MAVYIVGRKKVIIKYKVTLNSGLKGRRLGLSLTPIKYVLPHNVTLTFLPGHGLLGQHSQLKKDVN